MSVATRRGMLARLRLRLRLRPRLGRGRVAGGAGRRRSTRRTVLAVLAAAVLLGLGIGGWQWLRDSSLVAVERVQVTGATGPDAAQIRASLAAAARGMTTLHVRMSALYAAASPYPIVRRLRVSAQFPHGMRIAVLERTPVAEVTMGSAHVPVSADGMLLRDAAPAAQLPLLTLSAQPGGSRVDDASARLELVVLAAAPAPLLARIVSIRVGYWHGAVLTLRRGPLLYFGDGSAAEAKWKAVVALLANPADAGAAYLDVSDPARPAAGANVPLSTLNTLAPSGG